MKSINNMIGRWIKLENIAWGERRNKIEIWFMTYSCIVFKVIEVRFLTDILVIWRCCHWLRNEETNTVRRRLVVRTKTYMLLKNSLSQDVGVVVHVTSNPDVYFCSHVYGGSYEFVSLSGQNVSIISSSIHGPWHLPIATIVTRCK